MTYCVHLKSSTVVPPVPRTPVLLFLTQHLFRCLGLPEFCGRLARNLPKNTVEVGQRLETDVVSNFAHAPIRIKQLGLCSFDTYSTQILSKCQACRLLEHFAE